MSDRRRPPAITVAIEELVLHGFAPADRYRIGGALERELARLCAGEGLAERLRQDGPAERLDAGAFDVPAGSRPEAIGVQVARSVFRSLLTEPTSLTGNTSPRGQAP